MQPHERIILIGRSVEDYRACGTPIPDDFSTLLCSLCGTKTVISPYGAKVLHQYPQNHPVVLCNPCGLLLAEAKTLRGGQGRLAMSDHATKQTEKSKEAKRWVAHFEDLLGPEGPI